MLKNCLLECKWSVSAEVEVVASSISEYASAEPLQDIVGACRMCVAAS